MDMRTLITLVESASVVAERAPEATAGTSPADKFITIASTAVERTQGAGYGLQLTKVGPDRVRYALDGLLTQGYRTAKDKAVAKVLLDLADRLGVTLVASPTRAASGFRH